MLVNILQDLNKCMQCSIDRIHLDELCQPDHHFWGGGVQGQRERERFKNILKTKNCKNEEIKTKTDFAFRSLSRTRQLAVQCMTWPAILVV